MLKPLTSLRFVFALFVFLSHLNWIPANYISFNLLYDNVLSQGNVGVSFFFILSGFILSLNYKNKIEKNKVSVKEFYVARVGRIYPLHLVTLIFAVPLVISEFIKSPIAETGSLLSNIFLLQSFIPFKQVFFGFNPVSWSISNEMFYYLMFPVIILALYRSKKAIYLSFLFLILVPVGIYFCPQDLMVAIFGISPFIRISDFIIGILLFKIYEIKIIQRWFENKFTAGSLEVVVILIFILFFFFHQEIYGGYRGSSYYWLPMSLIILVFSYQAGFISRILSWQFFILLGEISFSFYMFHVLIMRYVRALNFRLEFTSSMYVLIGIILVVTLVISYFSYLYIEIPANRYIRNKYRKKTEAKRVLQQVDV